MTRTAGIGVVAPGGRIMDLARFYSWKSSDEMGPLGHLLGFSP